MTDEDLFASDTSAGSAPENGVAAPGPDRATALIDEHFPHLDNGGVEAHQPIREFLLAFARIFPF